MTEYDGDEQFPSGGIRILTAIARLVRLPNLFTAPPDIVLGAAIVAGLGYVVPLWSVIGLSFVSVLLYAAGTTLNDYFDAAEDAHERPERPIPVGTVSRSQALAIGVSLLAGGIAFALAVGGTTSGVVATCIALLIVGYDGVFKGSPAGYLFMGGARGVNVLLGTTVAVVPTALPARSLLIPVIVTLYIAAVTYMAESETEGDDHAAVVAAVVATMLAIAGVVGILAVRSPPPVDTLASVAFLVVFVIWVGRPLSAAYAEPSPETVGPAVGACVLGLVFLNAAFAGTISFVWAAAVAACFVPAFKLAGVFDVS